MPNSEIAEVASRLEKLEKCVRRFSVALTGDPDMQIVGLAERLTNVEVQMQGLVDANEAREAVNRGIMIGLGLTGLGTLGTAVGTILSIMEVV